MATIGIVDDHVLVRKGIINLLENLGHQIVVEASNGKQFIDALDKSLSPDIVLIDINMPVMDGFETVKWLSENKPLLKVLVLSMFDDEYAIVKMVSYGARGFILKDCEPGELQTAITSLTLRNYYHSELVSSKLVRSLQSPDNGKQSVKAALQLTDREKEFLKYCCSEMTYKEISHKMGISTRTIDGYRENLFQKLEIRSRVGLVLFAINHGIVQSKQRLAYSLTN